MKKALRITCYNEGTQEVTLVSQKSAIDNITIHRSNIGHTLELLHNSNQLQLFDTIIITDDGSTDDTTSCIHQFIQSYQYNNFIVLSDSKNKGKGARFVEAMAQCLQANIDILVSTDADMLHPGDTLPSLINILSADVKHMRHVISPYYETNIIEEIISPETHGQYIGESGTRGTHVPTRHHIYGNNKNGIDFLFSKGNYALEAVLEHIFNGMKLSIYKEDNSYSIAPVFFQAFRTGKSSQLTQKKHRDFVYNYFMSRPLV